MAGLRREVRKYMQVIPPDFNLCVLRFPWWNEAVGIPWYAGHAWSDQVSQKNWLHWQRQGKGARLFIKRRHLILFVQSRVWPGQKMPGQVGGKYNWACGLRVSELTFIHIWYNLPVSRCGVSTMMNLCSTFRAHQYLARLGTLCKSATQEFQDTGEQ